MTTTVADLLAWEEQPEAVRALALRVLLPESGEAPSFEVAKLLELLADAYEQGYSDCADAFDPPHCSTYEADYVARRIAREHGFRVAEPKG
jgi:hypothetical protein